MVTEEELSKKIGVKDKLEPTSGNLTDEEPQKQGDFLRMLELALFTPVLSLVKIYLNESNGSKKTEENCLADFRKKHPRTFKSMFSFDLFFRFVYLVIVFLVAARGLGIDVYIKTLIGK